MKANCQYRDTSISYARQHYNPAEQYPMWRYKLDEIVEKFYKMCGKVLTTR